MSDWKDHHADESEKVMEVDLVREALDEFADNMRRNYGIELNEGLPKYGLVKVCMYVAQVARAQALGFDPELLRLNAEEAEEKLLRLAETAATTGKPVYLIKIEEGL